MSFFEILDSLRQHNGGLRVTDGLPSSVIDEHAKDDPRLEEAIRDAKEVHKVLCRQHPEVLKLPEDKQVTKLQEGFVNFYGSDAVNPYVPLAAKGPWIVTSCGAVVFDTGGYGMLGQGHNPAPVLEALAKPQVMANIMTASFVHRDFTKALRREIGHSRPEGHREPYQGFLCLNSGSESVTFSMRIADINAFHMTKEGALHAGNTIKLLSFKGAFHGRTDRPSQVSDSSLGKYKAALASFRHLDNLITIPPNDVAALEQAFREANEKGWFIEAVLLEPVMGEGNPGLALAPRFYERARELTKQHGSMLIIDAIQAGLRTYGCLSIMDYPGFTTLEAPDMETYSKALNAGQFPLSVVAFGPRAFPLYVRGTYGNTMTSNPRALAVACAVLESLKPELRKNIRDRGTQALEAFGKLASEFPDVITKVQGTGLLFSVDIHPDAYTVIGADGLEAALRKRGIGVIHGGKNALRYTPTFDISALQIDLLVDSLRSALQEVPRLTP